MTTGNIIIYDSRPILKSPILIEGLPGVGNVGKIAVDYMADKLNAHRIARVYSEDLAPQVMVTEDNTIDMADNELWLAEDVNGHDLVFLRGDYQATSQPGQYTLSETVFRMILKHDPAMIVTLGGYGTGGIVMEPRVIAAVTDISMKPRLEECGIEFNPNEPPGGIVGAAAMLVGFGGMYGIESVCIMGETSGFIQDSKSARNVISCLNRYLGIEMDLSGLDEAIAEIDNINLQAQAINNQGSPEDLSYIG